MAIEVQPAVSPYLIVDDAAAKRPLRSPDR